MVLVQQDQRKPRWMVSTVLFLSCTMMIGSFYCLENPAALMKQLEYEMDLSNLRFNMWYAATYAAVLLSSVTVSAKLCRKCGHGLAIVFFSVLVTGGQSLFALGCSRRGEQGYWMAFGGRVLFGFGYESLVTANQGLLSDWLAHSDNAQYFWSLGAAYCIARLVAVVNYNISPVVVEYFQSVPHGLWLGAVICGASVVAAVALALLTWKCGPQPTPQRPAARGRRGEATAAQEVDR